MQREKYHHGDLKNALIQAGMKILAKEGIGGLTLRKVARKAGVSHSAPYAHFPDKQALIAAISTEGFRQLYEALDRAIAPYAGNPLRQLSEAALAYLQFTVSSPEAFRIIFSGVLEKEKEYPAFVEASHRLFERLVGLVQSCQAAGVLRSAPAELVAVCIWGQLHGIISLHQEGQISHVVLDQHSLHQMVLFALEQWTVEKD